MFDDERAVSVTVGYVLNFAVAALLISGLLVAGGELIDSQTKQVTTDELTIVGQQIADELSSADRLVRAGGVSTLSMHNELPRRTAAGAYTINVTIDGRQGTIELRTHSPDVFVTVPFRIQSDLQEERIDGGPIRIEYDADTDSLRVVSV